MSGHGFTAVSASTGSASTGPASTGSASTGSASSAVGRRSRFLRGWRLTAFACSVALACTVLGGVVGGYVAVRAVTGQLDPSYTIGPVPAAPANRPANSLAGIAARDTPGVVMIKVDDGAGTGSGFVINGGYIVTNNHVVTLDGEAPGASIMIYLSNGNSVAGRLVGRDPYSDIAVLKAVDTARLAALPLGNSASVAVGDPVIAIGSPLGLADTVTSGIVSALNRPIEPGAAGSSAPEAYFDAIQTDAAINPGSSGGPLVNASGQVIGVDAALDTLGGNPLTGTPGGSIGLGFAIPVNQARRVIVQLIQTGYATHSVLGAALNESYSGTGAQIATSGQGGQRPVTPGGPAARAGLAPGEVITKLDGQPIDDSSALLDAIRSVPPGSRVELTAVRHGVTVRTSLKLGSARS